MSLIKHSVGELCSSADDGQILIDGAAAEPYVIATER